MEVSFDNLLKLFQVAYRIGESSRTYARNKIVAASNAEIDADAKPIIETLFGDLARSRGVTEQHHAATRDLLQRLIPRSFEES